MLQFLKEFWLFLRTRKKFWLLPMVFAVVLVAILIVTTEQSTIAPFIYTLF